MPNISDVTTNILHIGCTPCFLIVSFSLFVVFFFHPPTESRATSVFLVNQQTVWQGFLKTPGPCAVWWFVRRWTKAPGQAEGYHSWEGFFPHQKNKKTKNSSVVIFLPPLSHHSWLDGWIASTRKKLGSFSRHLCGGEPPHNVRHDPNFLMRKAGAFPLLVILKRGYFSFKPVSRWGSDVNLGKHAVRPLGEWLRHLSKLLASVQGGKRSETQPTERKTSIERPQHFLTNRINRVTALTGSLQVLVPPIPGDWF